MPASYESSDTFDAGTAADSAVSRAFSSVSVSDAADCGAEAVLKLS
ncbi:MAG: hypothetical protein LBH50_05825 [Spirochaetaceae bacterium]|nr:hypothetical protein [Spirochaetaceae bacterium]